MQIKESDNLEAEISNKYYSLSFEYTFEYENDEVSFAYSPPYTFSHLKNVILDLKKNHNCFCIHQVYLETIIT